MDALKDRVLNERIRILNAQFEKALEQRNRFAENFFKVIKKPYQERREELAECDNEIDEIRQLSLPGFID